MTIIPNAVKEMKASKYVIEIRSNVVRRGFGWDIAAVLLLHQAAACTAKAGHQLYSMFVTLRRRKSFVCDVQGGEHMIINFKSLSNRV